MNIASQFAVIPSNPVSIYSFSKLSAFLTICLWVVLPMERVAFGEISIEDDLKSSGYQLVYESYVERNWELFVINADGTGTRNLTQTPDVHELYPQVSPDGTKICFVSDKGTGRKTVRSVYVMNVDGSERKLIAERARQPFWHPDSKTIAYLPQEYKKWNVVDYYTKGMVYHHLPTGKSRPHPNHDKLHHLYNPGFSADGKWIVSTVHAGMGYQHAILLLEAEGDQIIDLGVHGCRPCFSPVDNRLAWGPGDHEIAVAEIDFDVDPPRIGPKQIQVIDKTLKIYHVDWSPDGQFLSISRGPTGDGDISKAGTHQSACEIVGVYAPGWNLIALSAEKHGTVNLEENVEGRVLTLTRNGKSNKESDWIKTH